MKEMIETESWRVALKLHIQDTQKRKRLAQQLQVNPATLTRWANGTSTPQARHRDEVLYLLSTDTPTFERKPLEVYTISPEKYTSQEEKSEEVASGVYAQVLDMLAQEPDPQQFLWSMCKQVFHNVLRQLDPQHLGMGIVMILCTPPPAGKPVRSIYTAIGQGQGTSQWNTDTTLAPCIFYGAESLSASVVATGRVAMVEDCEHEQERVSFSHTKGANCIAAAPIKQHGRVAGCLTIGCTQPYHISTARLTCLTHYANLLALALPPEDFYEHEQMMFGMMPSIIEQLAHNISLGQHIVNIIRQAASHGQILTRQQAERLALQHMEEYWLMQSYSRQQNTISSL